MTSQICSAAAVAAGFKLPYPTFPCGASVAQSLRPFPEYSVSLAPQFADQGDSFYDSLQVKFRKRMSHGLDLTSNYTFSKTENIGGYINADPSNRIIQKGLDSNDYPHIWVTAFTYRTPKVTENKFIRAVDRQLDVGSHPAVCERRLDRGASVSKPTNGPPTHSHPVRPWCGFPACLCI